MAGVPYVGSGVLASAVGMDKVTMKKIFAHHGLPQGGHDRLDHHVAAQGREGDVELGVQLMEDLVDSPESEEHA